MFIHEIREQRNKAITSRQVAALGRRANKTIQTSEMGNRASTNRIRAVPAGMIGLYEKRGGGQASSYFRQVFALLSVKISYRGG